MMFEIFFFVLGLILLVVGADYFVKYASLIAKRLGVSEFIIGLTLVSLGTSIPELASSVVASIFKDSGLIIGNIVGSNIANIGLVIGLIASFYLIKTKGAMLKRDGFIMLFAVVLFFLFTLDGVIGRSEGLVFIFFYGVYLLFLFEEKPGEDIRSFIRYFFRLQYLATIRSRVLYIDHKKKKIKQRKKVKRMFEWQLVKDIVFVILSGGAIVLGADFLIREAVFFAGFFNISSNIIGISLIALGTSLPELIVSFSAARKGFGGIAIGNIIGSNIANIFLVGGVAALIIPLEIVKSTIYFTVPFMILMTLLLLMFLKTRWRIKRWEGMILVFLYILMMVLLFSGWVF
ncbi:MAG: calcium/sodium antiporter [Nanoarchaeota archaeon]|nr:calcium/sodium antiporter [Nanoarchaeota archaeon]